jgi:hypothetical protein
MPIRVVRTDSTGRAGAITAIHAGASPLLRTTSADTLRIEWVDFLR